MCVFGVFVFVCVRERDIECVHVGVCAGVCVCLCVYVFMYVNVYS